MTSLFGLSVHVFYMGQKAILKLFVYPRTSMFQPRLPVEYNIQKAKSF